MDERAKEKEQERLKREQKEKERLEMLKRDEQNIASAVAAAGITANGVTPAEGSDSISTNPAIPPNTTPDAAGTTQTATPDTSANNSMEVDVVIEKEKELTPEELEAKRKKEEREAKKAADKEKRLEVERIARKEEFQNQELKYAEEIAAASARYSINPLGEDRIFRRYWSLRSIPGVFVERDENYINPDFDFTPVPQNPKCNPLLPFNMKPQGVVVAAMMPQPQTVNTIVLPQPQVGEEVKDHNTSNSSNKENIDIEALAVSTPQQDTGAVLGDQVKPQVINGIIEEPDIKILTPEPADLCALRKEHIKWAYFSTPEQIDQLVIGLNSRGYRESALKEALLQEKKKIQDSLKDVPLEFLQAVDEDEEGPDMTSTPRQVVVKMNSGKKGLVSDHANGEESLELLLREQILYIEDRVWQGGLGIIKVSQSRSKQGL